MVLEGLGHGRSGFIPSRPSGSLLVNSNEPMSSPGQHILFVFRNCCASNPILTVGTPCMSSASTEENNDTLSVRSNVDYTGYDVYSYFLFLSIRYVDQNIVVTETND